MGLYDELEVQYPLPDGWDPASEVFQTKDTPEQYLLRYVLDAEGTLREKASGEAVPYHGALTFYTGNACAYGPWGFATRDDQPPWWAEYTCLYDHGRLLKIEGAKCPQTDLHGPHLTRAEWHVHHRKTGEK